MVLGPCMRMQLALPDTTRKNLVIMPQTKPASGEAAVRNLLIGRTDSHQL